MHHLQARKLAVILLEEASAVVVVVVRMDLLVVDLQIRLTVEKNFQIHHYHRKSQICHSAVVLAVYWMIRRLQRDWTRFRLSRN